MLSSYLMLLSGLVGLASAHFTLDYPTARGFDEDIEPQFCGGFAAPNATRSPFPLTNGIIQIDSHHSEAVVGVVMSLSSDPTSFSDFTSAPMLFNFTTINGQGEFCLTTDASTLNTKIANGTIATIQVVFNGGDGELYQCADIVFDSSATTPSNITCPSSNTVSSPETSSGPETSAPAASSAATGSPTSSTSGAETTQPFMSLAGLGVIAMLLCMH